MENILDLTKNQTLQITSHSCHLNIPINAENDALPTLYWIPNIHKNPYREGYNAGSSTCSTKELSI